VDWSGDPFAGQRVCVVELITALRYWSSVPKKGALGPVLVGVRAGSFLGIRARMCC
jgi:hypothetical protein